nr:MAG TPA: hypothetical protein [Caudoviricetes sp.]
MIYRKYATASLILCKTNHKPITACIKEFTFFIKNVHK